MGSPKIISIRWGRMTIENIGSGRDFKLWPGGGRDWDWNETGTHHSPGIQSSDIEELISHGSEIVVLSRGFDLSLGLSRESVDYLKNRDVEYYFEQTKAAVELYNRLAKEGRKVGGLFHSTC